MKSYKEMKEAILKAIDKCGYRTTSFVYAFLVGNGFIDDDIYETKPE